MAASSLTPSSSVLPVAVVAVVVVAAWLQRCRCCSASASLWWASSRVAACSWRLPISTSCAARSHSTPLQQPPHHHQPPPWHSEWLCAASELGQRDQAIRLPARIRVHRHPEIVSLEWWVLLRRLHCPLPFVMSLGGGGGGGGGCALQRCHLRLRGMPIRLQPLLQSMDCGSYLRHILLRARSRVQLRLQQLPHRTKSRA
eukprot:SAG25_NODE_1695_length_2530_cov_1.901687_1_plen_200_part_00